MDNDAKKRLDDLEKIIHSTPTTPEPNRPNVNKLQKLSDKHIVFCNEYVNNNGNGKEAAIKAGYSEATAVTKASMLLNDPLITAELTRIKAETRKNWDIDRNWILQQYMDIIVSSVEEGTDGTGLIKDRAHWLKATQAIAKTLGLDEPTKVDVTSGGKPINIQYIKPERPDTDE